MIKLKQAIVVEGRYDKNTLRQLIDAPIFETSGFGVMKNRELVSLLRLAAERRGLVILTDSDGAGFVIRSRLKSCLPPDKIKQAYVPDVYGKERRKASPSAEGKLGVEGIPPEILLEILERAGLLEGGGAPRSDAITKADLYRLGLSGADGSAGRRRALCRALDLPQGLSANALPGVLSRLITVEELERLAATL